MQDSSAALLVGVGKKLFHYQLDIEACSLVKRGELHLSEDLHYAWRHASRPVLYVACSNHTSHVALGSVHSLQVLWVDKESGQMSVVQKLELSYRPIHITTDSRSRHVLVAFNKPAELWVFRVNPDGTLGDRVPQRDGRDMGIYPHQVRVSPDDQLVTLATRGNPDKGHEPKAHVGDQVDPGALKVFEYEEGRLGNEVSIAPGGGRRFGPRHLDFHPGQSLVYVSVETQNQLCVFRREGGRLSEAPIHAQDLLENPATPQHQGSGAIHVHPDGNTLYCSNRGHRLHMIDGKEVVVDGENSIVVFDIRGNPAQPKLVQHADAHGLCPRTFALDQTGRVLVACNSESHWEKRGGGEPTWVSANLAIFRVKQNGTLKFNRKYDFELGKDDKMNWMNIIQI